jgi:hypothetical protein
MWRADFAWPDHMRLVECEGGIFARAMRKGQDYGWHQSVKRMLDDMEKCNAATLLGYRVLRYAADTIEIMRPQRRMGRFLYYCDVGRAQRVVCCLLREEHARVIKERFVLQAVKEARAAFKELKEHASEHYKAAGPTWR